MKHAFMLILSFVILAALVSTLALYLRRLRRIEVDQWGPQSAQLTLRPLLRRSLRWIQRKR